jgi:hypothetical protein
MKAHSKLKTVPNSSKASAGLAGVGGGTLLVLLARQLPDSNPYKAWALLLAPSLSVTLSAALLWFQSILRTYLKLKRNDWVFQRVRTTLENFLSNPHTSAEHKERIRQQLEQLEMVKTNTELQLVSEDLSLENMTKT